MSNIFFISDLHLGHTNILKFSPSREGTTIEEHDEWIIDSFNSVVGKKDKTYILGDITFKEDLLKKVGRLNGNKFLIRGNHDTNRTVEYLKYFQEVYGLVKKHGFWLSHAPIHPQELRGLQNIHGHVHSNSILTLDNLPDLRYINVCVEALNGIPISLDEVNEKYKIDAEAT